MILVITGTKLATKTSLQEHRKIKMRSRAIQNQLKPRLGYLNLCMIEHLSKTKRLTEITLLKTRKNVRQAN